MKETLMLEGLIGWTGMLASGSFWVLGAVEVVGWDVAPSNWKLLLPWWFALVWFCFHR